MGKIINLKGKRFGRLFVTKEAKQRTRDAKVMWHCKCDCGSNSIVCGNQLRQGITRSCGCLRIDVLIKNVRKHGKTETNTYRSWCSAKRRTTNKNNSDWKYYGGRGISMCKRWRESFQVFFEDMGECPSGMTLERIDNNGHYEPENCRWATRKEQANNARNNIIIKYKNRKFTMAQYCRLFDLNYTFFRKRYRYRNLSVAMATAEAISYKIQQAMKGKKPWPIFRKM